MINPIIREHQPVSASEFDTFNLREVINRANSILLCMKKLALTNEEKMDLIIKKTESSFKDGDVWEATAWTIARGEIFERLICEQDPHIVVPQFQNGCLPF